MLEQAKEWGPLKLQASLGSAHCIALQPNGCGSLQCIALRSIAALCWEALVHCSPAPSTSPPCSSLRVHMLPRTHVSPHELLIAPVVTF